MTEHQIPPVPPECDLRDFAFIPLEFERLFASDTWVLGNPEEKVAAMHLWCKSWHQVPAASLPQDDRMLAHLSAAGPRWKKLKQHALRGWIACTDGRLYHPVVAEKAIKAWAEKLERRTQTHNARVAALRRRVASAATEEEHTLLQAALDALLQEPVTGTKGREGKGREEKGKVEEPLTDAARRPGVTIPTWTAYATAYEARYGVQPVRNKTVNAMLARFVERLGAEEAPHIAEFFVGHQGRLYVSSKHAVNLLLRDCEGLRTEWASGRKVTDTEARQADQTATRGAQAQRLIAATRKVA